jgi:CheY-like chemotaxis protein
VLVVDDRAADRLALLEALDDSRYEVVTAATGNEALRSLLREEFAIVLLDVLLPDVNGLEVARLMREHEPTRYTPILFLSAAGVDMAFVHKTYRGGPMEYLAKPVERSTLLSTVQLLLDLAEIETAARGAADA